MFKNELQLYTCKEDSVQSETYGRIPDAFSSVFPEALPS